MIETDSNIKFLRNERFKTIIVQVLFAKEKIFEMIRWIDDRILGFE